jgi:hypothetical protein
VIFTYPECAAADLTGLSACRIGHRFIMAMVLLEPGHDTGCCLYPAPQRHQRTTETPTT